MLALVIFLAALTGVVVWQWPKLKAIGADRAWRRLWSIAKGTWRKTQPSPIFPSPRGERKVISQNLPSPHLGASAREPAVYFNYNGYSFEAYETLGLSPGSSLQEVILAYQDLELSCAEETKEFFKAAYNALTIRLTGPGQK